MEAIRSNGTAAQASSVDGTTAAAARVLQPNYSSRAVREALEHLASVELIELCNEAKVERCRATRDLRSCGRYVDCVLNSCGHASLCAECNQRCDICPICRIPIPKNGNKNRLRLYYECIEAGLISKRCDERFQEKDDGETQQTVDIQRLYSLFDVAMENNLVSLICHYVTDVCMDESAVSSDPVIAFLLDEVVVKDWCKRTFRNILTELKDIYILEIKEMSTRMNILLKFSVHLAGITNVLEVLDSSFKGSLSAQLHDLHHLQESILKTKQHLEIMVWCIRHEFLENVKSRFDTLVSWSSSVRERKAAAINRAWPDPVKHSGEYIQQNGSLFIEDALLNLEIELEYSQKMGEELEIALLQNNKSSFFRSKIEGVGGCYPFENLRAAVDTLFLHGSSDLVLAKQATFLYYLFDRHWTLPDNQWRNLIDNFAATFGIVRHSLLESFTFYLLDDHTDEALQEACHLLPEISTPTTHPKIAQVLFERNNPDTALMVLRWSGRDGLSQSISLSEAVTAVRIRVECGLLTEAFTCQRMLCTKLRENKSKFGLTAELKGNHQSWLEWTETLVTEICFLCIRRNLVDRMIELPWNSDEEKYIHKCLFDCAVDDPTTSVGSLLVVFYLQRYRYAEAYRVNLKLQSVEQDFIMKNTASEDVLSGIQKASHWRAGLVDKSLELMPEVEQQLIKSGKLPDSVNHREEVEVQANSACPEPEALRSNSLLIPSVDSSLLQQSNLTSIMKSSVFDTPTRLGRTANNPSFKPLNHSSSFLRETIFASAERGLKSRVDTDKNFRFEKFLTPESHLASPPSVTPLSRASRSNLFPDNEHAKTSPETDQNGFVNPFRNTSPPYSHRVTANPMNTPNNTRSLFKDPAKDVSVKRSAKRVLQSSRDENAWNLIPSDNSMEISFNYRKDSLAGEDMNVDAASRWRSDETSDSDDDEEQSHVMDSGLASRATPMRGIRKSRFARR